MKTIYNYRSKIVHGGKLKDKDKYFEINGKKFDVSKIAVDFLRYSLLFVLEHQEFLDAKSLMNTLIVLCRTNFKQHLYKNNS